MRNISWMATTINSGICLIDPQSLCFDIVGEEGIHTSYRDPNSQLIRKKGIQSMQKTQDQKEILINYRRIIIKVNFEKSSKIQLFFMPSVASDRCLLVMHLSLATVRGLLSSISMPSKVSSDRCLLVMHLSLATLEGFQFLLSLFPPRCRAIDAYWLCIYRSPPWRAFIPTAIFPARNAQMYEERINCTVRQTFLQY